MEKEIWKDVLGYEGYYMVSNLGNVKSLERFRLGNKKSLTKVNERLLKYKIDKYGYKVYSLTKFAKTNMFTCHRLVAKSFIENPFNYDQVNHINGIKLDNRVYNLEWCNNSHNMKEAYKLGLIKPKKSKDNILSKKVAKIKDGEVICIYNSVADASKQNNVGKTAISNCLKGRSKSSCGCKWSYY